jgi:membrane protease YdiL (CAAX protease family)
MVLGPFARSRAVAITVRVRVRPPCAATPWKPTQNFTGQTFPEESSLIVEMTGTTTSKYPRHRGVDWPVVAFFVLAYAIAWGTILAMVPVARHAGMDSVAKFLGRVEALDFAAIPGELLLPQWFLYGLTRIADFAFSISGVILIAYTGGLAGLRELVARLTRWRISPLIAFAAFVPFFLYLVASLLKASGDLAIMNSLDLSSTAIVAALFGAETGIIFHIFFRGAMGEELGLRGFALPRLQARYSPVRASLIIGTFWFLWHLPALIGRSPAQFVIFGISVMLLSFIFTWLFNGSGGSLLPGIVFHALQNSEDAFERIFPALKGTSWEAPASIGLLLIGVAITGLVICSSKNSRKENICQG